MSVQPEFDTTTAFVVGGSPSQRASSSSNASPIRTVEYTSCCIVGAGPAGMILALLLAQQGIAVTLLESHTDFDREFRGDTLHPSVLELLNEMGLIDQVLQLRHTKVRQLSIPINPGTSISADFGRLKVAHPYVAMLPQSQFLNCLATEGQRYPHFRLVMGAQVHDLLSANGQICGVRYTAQDGEHEVRALLTVGADGRFSRVRKLAAIEPIKTSPPMDILWFRLPRAPSDPEGIVGRFGQGHILVMLDRGDEWQLGYVILKGSFQHLRATGLAALRQEIVDLEPLLADRVELLQDWKQCSLLSVESSRVQQWHRPGLLLIGDAAHVMSPVGGVGINYAIQDAVVAANVLSGPLKAGRVRSRDLASVQLQRELPTRIIQGIQTFIQQRLIANALNAEATFQPPLLLRLALRVPLLRNLPARLIGLGVWPVRVRARLRRAMARG